VGVPAADSEIVWHYIITDLIELALAVGPTEIIPPVVDQRLLPVPPLPRHNNRDGIGGRYTDDVNEFLLELNESDDEDDLLELNNAEDDNDVYDVNHRVDDANWTHEIVTPLVCAEVELFKNAKGIKL
jgi:hypothetical protein